MALWPYVPGPPKPGFFQTADQAVLQIVAGRIPTNRLWAKLSPPGAGWSEQSGRDLKRAFVTDAAVLSCRGHPDLMMRSPGPMGNCRAVIPAVTWTFAGFPRRIQDGEVSDRVWPACRVVTRVTGPPAVSRSSIQHGFEATTSIGAPLAIV